MTLPIGSGGGGGGGGGRGGLWGLLGRNSLGVYLGHWYLVTWPFVSCRDRFYTFLDAATAHRGIVASFTLHGVVFLALPLVACLLVGPALNWALLAQFRFLLRWYAVLRRWIYPAAAAADGDDRDGRV